MSRIPGYPRAGANGGYANGGYNNGAGYRANNAAADDYGGRPSGEQRRRPGGYGGLDSPDDGYAPRPSGERERRPGGFEGIVAREEEYARRPSSDRERRPVGYGGLSARRDDSSRRDDSGSRSHSSTEQGRRLAREREEEPAQVSRPTSLERTKAKRRSGERQNGAGRNRLTASNYGPGSQRIEEVLQHIQQKWDFMTKDQCIPVEVALKLMDSSSLGLADQYDKFQEAHRELQQALKTIVNGEYLERFRVWLAAKRDRAPPGLQQLDWYIPSNPIQPAKLPAQRQEAEKLPHFCQVTAIFRQARTERVCNRVSEL